MVILVKSGTPFPRVSFRFSGMFNGEEQRREKGLIRSLTFFSLRQNCRRVVLFKDSFTPLQILYRHRFLLWFCRDTVFETRFETREELFFGLMPSKRLAAIRGEKIITLRIPFPILVTYYRLWKNSRLYAYFFCFDVQVQRLG